MESRKKITSEKGNISKSQKEIVSTRIENANMKKDIVRNCHNKLRVDRFEKIIKIQCKGGIVKDPLDLKKLLDQLRGLDKINYIKDIDNLEQLMQQESFMAILKECLMSIESEHIVQVEEVIEQFPIETRKPIKMMISSMTVNE